MGLYNNTKQSLHNFSVQLILHTASTLNQLVTFISKESYIDDIIKKYLSDYNQIMEFKQYIMLEVLQSPNSGKTLSIYNNGEFPFWISKIITNNIKSYSSKWYRYLHPDNNTVQYQDYFNIDVEQETDFSHIKEKQLKDIDNILKQLYIENPLLIKEITIFKLYYFDNINYTQIAEKTKIPYTSVNRYVKTILDILQKKLKNKHYD